METIINFLNQTGFVQLLAGNWQALVMILISCVLFYLAIVKKFEPLLLLPIAFGMLLTNLPGAEMYHECLFAKGHACYGCSFVNASRCLRCATNLLRVCLRR